MLPTATDIVRAKSQIDQHPKGGGGVTVIVFFMGSLNLSKIGCTPFIIFFLRLNFEKKRPPPRPLILPDLLLQSLYLRSWDGHGKNDKGRKRDLFVA